MVSVSLDPTNRLVAINKTTTDNDLQCRLWNRPEDDKEESETTCLFVLLALFALFMLKCENRKTSVSNANRPEITFPAQCRK